MNDTQNKITTLTPQGLEKLQGELKDLLENKLPKIIDRVATAREFGDLSENSEYHSAREDHAWIQSRIDEVENILSRVKVSKNKSKSSIGVGNQVVVVTQKGEEHEFHVVGEWEADPMARKISHESPLGRALVGKKVGDIVEFEAPAGKISYTVKAIK